MKEVYYLDYYTTFECNLRCKHCFINWNKKSQLLYPNDIRKYFKFKTNHFALTGGEITTREDILDVTRACLETVKTDTFVFATNGILTERVLNTIKGSYDLFDKTNLFLFQTSIEGKKETHEQIRGKGNFDRTIETIKKVTYLKEKIEKLKVNINFCVNHLNFRELKYVYDLSKKLNADSFSFLFKMPLQKNKFNENQLDIIERQIKSINKDRIANFKEIKNIDLKEMLSEIITLYIEENMVYASKHRRPIPCLAGKDYLTIAPNGDVIPCMMLHKNDILGNVKNLTDLKLETKQCTKECNECWCYSTAIPNIQMKINFS